MTHCVHCSVQKKTDRKERNVKLYSVCDTLKAETTLRISSWSNTALMFLLMSYKT